MYLKNRLLLSSLINISAPLIIVIVVAFFYIMIYSNFSHVNIGVQDFETFIEVENRFLNIQKKISKNAENLVNTQYQNHIISLLKDFGIDIIVYSNSTDLFSSIDLTLIEKEKCIRNVENEKYNKVVQLDSGKYIVDYETIRIKNIEEFHVILLSKTSIGKFNFQRFYSILLLVYIITFVITNIILNKIYKKQLLEPLKKLCLSVEEITQDNINRPIVLSGDNEIEELTEYIELLRIKLKESIEKQNRLNNNRKVLISIMSHDLMTPITSIKGYVEAILNGVIKDKEKINSYLKNICNRTNTIETMIEDLFLYSKLDLQQIVFNLQKCDIEEFFKYFIEDMKEDLLKKNVKISLENNLKHNKIVLVDFENFKRVLTNVTSNACKYLDKQHGKITIFLRETHRDIIIDIKDNGMGIESSELNKIFNRFYRADESRSGFAGTGLGLAISKEIIEGFGGNIWARSKKGVWTSIIISLEKYGG
ncbi:MAG: HAMP domain-containing sensor histidine kinase [Clostridiales bacterium]